jgi:phosphate transport system permease protein
MEITAPRPSIPVPTSGVVPRSARVPRSKYRRNSGFADALFFNLTRLFAALTLLVLLGILASLVISSRPALQKFGLSFIWRGEWNPPAEQFGALIPIYGTLVTSFIALVIAVPMSFGIAFFLTELSPVWLRRPLGTAIELLAAIPSIVYGMWGLLVFAPFFGKYVQPVLASTLGEVPFVGALFRGPPLGIGLLTAGIILAIMIIPFIAAVMRDVFNVAPAMLKESAYALGATTWEVMRKVVLSYTKIGVVGGVMLGLGRAIGETMAVTFVIGNTNFLSNASLFSPGNSITSALANEFQEADPGLHSAALIELGLILFLITFLVLAASKLLLMRLRVHEGAKT